MLRLYQFLFSFFKEQFKSANLQLNFSFSYRVSEPTEKWNRTRIYCLHCFHVSFLDVSTGSRIWHRPGNIWSLSSIFPPLKKKCILLLPMAFVHYLKTSCWIKNESPLGLSTKFCMKDWGMSSSVWTKAGQRVKYLSPEVCCGPGPTETGFELKSAVKSCQAWCRSSQHVSISFTFIFSLLRIRIRQDPNFLVGSEL